MCKTYNNKPGQGVHRIHTVTVCVLTEPQLHSGPDYLFLSIVSSSRLQTTWVQEKLSTFPESSPGLERAERSVSPVWICELCAEGPGRWEELLFLHWGASSSSSLLPWKQQVSCWGCLHVGDVIVSLMWGTGFLLPEDSDILVTTWGIPASAPWDRPLTPTPHPPKLTWSWISRPQPPPPPPPQCFHWRHCTYRTLRHDIILELWNAAAHSWQRPFVSLEPCSALWVRSHRADVTGQVVSKRRGHSASLVRRQGRFL